MVVLGDTSAALINAFKLGHSFDMADLVCVRPYLKSEFEVDEHYSPAGDPIPVVPAEHRMPLLNRMLRSLQELEKVYRRLDDETLTYWRLRGYGSWQIAYDTVRGEEVEKWIRSWQRNNGRGNKLRRKIVKIWDYLKREGIPDLRKQEPYEWEQAGIPIGTEGVQLYWLDKEENAEEGFAGGGYTVLPENERDVGEVNTVRKRCVPRGERSVVE
jgi:hypothetical protein